MTHHRARHRCLRAAAPLLGLLAIAVPTAQAADWTPAIDVGPSATAPVGALSGSGDAVAAWHTANAVAIYRSRSTATWGAPFISAEAVATQPAVAAAGNSAVVAYESDGVVYAAVYESGGWQAAASFGPGSTPEVGVDASGDALLVWLDDTGTVMQAVRSAAGSWSSGGAMSLPGAEDLDLAVNPAGAAIASWRMPVTGAHAILGGTGSGFIGTGSAIDLSATATTEVDAAIGSDGTAVVVWADDGAIRAGYRANGGGGTFDIDTVVAGLADSPAVAVDSNGLALVGWRTDAGAVQWSSSTNGAWSGSGATLGAGGAAGSVVAAANGAGQDLALGWVTSGVAARTAVRPTGGGWGVELHDSGTTASVAVDTAGDVLSVWQGATGARTATFDSSAPTLDITVPATAVAGASVSLSASAGDLWSSSVSNPAWDFGDGTPDGSGFSVQHAWSSAGSKTVTANVTDAAGNAAAPASATISITAAPPTNSVAPSVSGAAYRDGTVLTAANGSWTGAPSFDHQWQRCTPTCANIAGAGNATYTPAAADVGSTVRVLVTGSNAGGDATAASAETPAIAPRSTSAPVVSGPFLLDAETLTTTNGGWNGLNESTSPALTFARQWQRCNASGGACADIAGATGASYVLDAADVGSRMRSIVTASRNGAATSAIASATGVIAPLNTTGPVIAGAGSASDGTALSVAAGNSSNAWGDAAGLSYTYEWKRCDQNGNSCNAVVGTNPTYTPGAADVGLRLRLAVTAEINGASTTSDDSAVATEKVAPRNTVAPVVDSAPRVDGQVLSASQGVWNGATGLTFAYQWRRCDSAGANCVNTGTGPTVTLGPADVGMRHGLVVSASKNGSAADAADSGLTAATVAPLATSPSTIAGFAQDAATLNATPGDFNGVGGLSYRYQWQRCSPSCSDIAGATAAAYTPGAADVGTTVKVSVDARKSTSAFTEGQLSAASAVIAPRETAIPLLTGQPKDGTAIGTDGGDWNGVGGLTRTYQWQLCDAQGAGCANVSSGATVTPGAPAVGSTYRVLVSASKGGSALVAGGFSAPSGVIAPRNTVAPALTLTPKDGSAASTSDGAWNGAALDPYQRQWERCDSAGANCADISGATAATYSVGPADVGSRVRSVVTASKNGGATSHASTASAIIAPLNTGPATVSGTAKDGSVLSATAGEWNGATGLAVTQTWKRCDAAGTNCNTQVGTGASYTPGAGDVGFPLKVSISASKNGSATTSGLSDSLATAVIAPRNTQVPALSGTSTDGQTLTASGVLPPAWNGAAGLAITQEWLRCAYPAWTTCTPIAGQTGTTYLLTSGDIDAKIKLRVTAAKNGASTVAESGTTSAVAPRVPVPDINSRPFLTNSGPAPMRIGQTAFANPGGWNTGALTFTFSWRACPTPQNPSNCPEVGSGNQFSIPDSLVGKWLSILVTARTSNLVPPQLTSSTAAVSAGLQIADNSLSVLELPLVSGTPVDGSTLTSTDPAWDPAHDNNSYHWQRCTTTEWPDSCDAIPGALDSSYTLTPADVGKYVTIRIRGTYSPYFTDAWPEFTTPIVAARAPRNTAAPSLSGTAAVGSVLTAAPGTWDGTPTIAFAYHWLRCDAAGAACTPIVGATGATYTLAEADATRTLRARVTASNAGGVTSADSGATAVVPMPAQPPAITPGVTPPPVITPPPVVAKKDRKAPVVRLKLAAGANVRSGARLLVRVTCPQSETSCTGSVVLRGDVLGLTKAFRRGVRLASARFKLKGGKATTVRLVLAAPAQRTLNSLGKMRAELRATAVDAAGNKGLGKARVTLRRPRNTTFGQPSGA